MDDIVIERRIAEIIDALNNAGAWKAETPFGTPISKDSAKEILEALNRIEEAPRELGH